MKDWKLRPRAQAGAGNIESSASEKDKKQRIMSEINRKMLPAKEVMDRNDKSQKFNSGRERINKVMEI
ncbi:MAG: hypothetical protein H5U05_08375 [Candidatus Aminicenantes bacterium]|nr:hypothetical protein [Candidatus Aminicenantes bacterium]